ncbi:MAG: MBL fold metallo-hydrolase [Mycobacteriaceae bacterium]
MKTPARLAALAAVTAPVAWLAWAAQGLPTSLGASRRAVADHVRSVVGPRPAFRNTLPASKLPAGEGKRLLQAMLSGRGHRRPTTAVPLVSVAPPSVAGDLAVTWFGHASALLEVDGQRVLLDPVWGHRISPSRHVGPTRLHPAPVSLEQLPQLDAVLISHDHYDHLDLPTVRALLRTQSAPFVVPLGVGAHLRGWGVPDERVVELDWTGSRTVGGLTLTCTEARHFSGRGLRNNDTLWSSWVVTGPRHRVFFGGDSGYGPSFARIGAEHGPFDLTLLPVGAYAPQWPDVHLNPEEAVAAHLDLTGGDPRRALLLPIHWATFVLAPHPWAEPVQRLLVAADASGVPVAVPLPGQRIDVTDVGELVDWWTPAS